MEPTIEARKIDEAVERHIGEKLDLLTNSRLKDARACLRRHRLKYIDGYRAVREVSNLRFGSLAHLGLEAWWTSHMHKDAGGALANGLQAMQGEADPFERARAEVMLTGYDARWGAEMGRYEVLAVELKFEVELVNPKTGKPSRTWRLAGKLDAVLRERATERVLIVEHKTAAGDISPGSEYWRRLRMDGQVSVYYEGARASGFDVQGCLYDVLGKPGQRPLKATPLEDRKFKKDGTLYANQRAVDETADEFRARLVEALIADPAGHFQRGEVVRLEEECADSMIDVWEIGRVIRDAEIAGRAPRNPDACVQYGRTCEFFDVCTGQGSLDNPQEYQHVDNVFPELSGE